MIRQRTWSHSEALLQLRKERFLSLIMGEISVWDSLKEKSFINIPYSRNFDMTRESGDIAADCSDWLQDHKYGPSVIVKSDIVARQKASWSSNYEATWMVGTGTKLNMKSFLTEEIRLSEWMFINWLDDIAYGACSLAFYEKSAILKMFWSRSEIAPSEMVHNAWQSCKFDWASHVVR